MENKYYTPDLEDFCIGYEYEESITALPPFKYEKHKIKAAWEIAEVGRYCNVRTKYLDKEDIEKEGWVFQGNVSTNFTGEEHEVYKKDNLWFTRSLEEDFIEIQNEYKMLLRGYIKISSINELRKIMKYLGIK